MKILSIYRFVATLILSALIFSGCGPTPAAPTNTPLPLPTDIPMEVPIDLAGPEVGSNMVWVDNSKLVFNPGGDFTMGAGGNDNPEHRVSLSPFWIYRTEVTNRQYALCIVNGQCTEPLDEQAAADLDRMSLRENPVVGVDWQQASDYCSWVSGRLPTEAEWELTARGPDGNLYPWGEPAPTCELTNFKDCAGSSTRVYDYPLGKSYYDALDMAGNVIEWVGDLYNASYYPISPIQDPRGPESGAHRVVRGGSFEADTSELASAKRSNFDPTRTRPDLGFRCVVQSPVLYPPFCQASAFIADIDPKNVSPSGGSCEINAKTKAQGCGTVTADIKGGTISDITASNFECSEAGDTRVFCSGQAESSDSITICGTCTNDVPQLAQQSLSACGNAFSAIANAAGDSSQCNYQGGPPQNGCSSGMVENSDGSCSQPLGGISRCPVGMYLDKNKKCTSASKQQEGCLAGFTYDAQAGCCSGTSYPGCEAGEVETPYGCVQTHPSTESTNTSCVTLTLDTGTCPKDGSGGPGAPDCSMSCAPSEILNSANCTCEPNPNW
jgi:hypothetical protein